MIIALWGKDLTMQFTTPLQVDNIESDDIIKEMLKIGITGILFNARVNSI